MSGSKPTTAGAERLGGGEPVEYFWSPDHVGLEYRALVAGCGLVRLGARTQIELRGADRATFLHNLTTNDVRNLPPGRGCEAFLLNAQGKTLFLVTAFADDEAHWLDTASGVSERLVAHLDRYLIREQVELIDRTAERRELLLAGPGAADVLRAATGQEPPTAWLAHARAPLGEATVDVRRTDWTGPAEYLLSVASADAQAVATALVARGAEPCGLRAFEQARVERGTPWPGIDVTEANLPQEIGRASRTLSFTKGCYIGQETVARIDALGHVNRKLAGIRFAPDARPEAGADVLSWGGKPAGGLTSVIESPRLQAPLALGYVRAAQSAAGTELDSPWGSAQVVKLPLA